MASLQNEIQSESFPFNIFKTFLAKITYAKFLPPPILLGKNTFSNLSHYTIQNQSTVANRDTTVSRNVFQTDNIISRSLNSQMKGIIKKL
jgi:hypothetical protein